MWRLVARGIGMSENHIPRYVMRLKLRPEIKMDEKPVEKKMTVRNMNSDGKVGNNLGSKSGSGKDRMSSSSSSSSVVDLTSPELVSKVSSKRKAIDIVEDSPAPSKKSKRKCPPGMNQDAFDALPEELQIDILKEHEEKEEEKVSVLSYNVWFRMDVAIIQRMLGIVEIVAKEKPTFVGLQEVTIEILRMLGPPLKKLGYDVKVQGGGQLPYFVALCSLIPFDWCKERDFSSTQMNRALLFGQVTLKSGTKVVVGTTHLESPIPPYHGDALGSKERKLQCVEALDALKGAGEFCILLGDLNWTEGGRRYKSSKTKFTIEKDGELPLPGGWVDCWTAAHPPEGGPLVKNWTDSYWERSCTYNAVANPMLRGSLQYRADRILVKSGTHQVRETRLVGTTPIPGAKTSDGKQVLPSDHFGVFTELQ